MHEILTKSGAEQRETIETKQKNANNIESEQVCSRNSIKSFRSSCSSACLHISFSLALSPCRTVVP